MNSSRVVLATAALLLLSPGISEAADPAVNLPQSYDWSGLYIGGSLGYGQGQHDTELLDIDHESTGWLGGVQVGYNQQIGMLVLGIEADYNFAGVGSDDVVETAGDPAFFLGDTSVSIEHEIDRLATVRGRLGVAFDRFLPYATAGYAYGRNESSARAVLTGFSGPFAGLDGIYTGSHENDHDGWVAGAGLEAALTQNVSLRAEYLHVDLGSETYTALPQLDPVAREHDITLDVFRIGMNYRFPGTAAGPFAGE